jgi:hypothetical protein
LEWDVLKSDSLRSELQGFVRFDVPRYLEETQEAKGSARLDKRYHEFMENLRASENANPASAGGDKYRYVFDLGPDAPELRKAQILTFPMTTFAVYEPQADGYCWDRIARASGDRQGRSN